MNAFGFKSRRELRGVHADLIIVTTTALVTCDQDFSVYDGIRTLAEQRENVRKGVSKTLDSRHLTGHAVDLVPIVDGRLSWDDPQDAKRQKAIDRAFSAIAEAMANAADLHHVPVEWGFSLWGWDKPHFQLPRRDYPV